VSADELERGLTQLNDGMVMLYSQLLSELDSAFDESGEKSPDKLKILINAQLKLTGELPLTKKYSGTSDVDAAGTRLKKYSIDNRPGARVAAAQAAYTLALIHLFESGKIRPNESNIHLVKLGKAFAEHSIELDDTVAQHYVIAAWACVALQDQKNLALGGRYANRATELDPTNAEAWRFVGLAKRGLRDFAGSERALARALELNPSSEARELLETVKRESGLRAASSAVPSEEVGAKYWRLWLRWYIWIVSLGVAYHLGRLVVLASQGQSLAGVYGLITGVIGYIVLGVIIAALVALVANLSRFVIWPTTMGMGVIRAAVIGAIFGILGALQLS
jgi:tetratricopeptide (TPR) repeat protein